MEIDVDNGELHAKAITGQKQWVAVIEDTHPTYNYEREFVAYQKPCTTNRDSGTVEIEDGAVIENVNHSHSGKTRHDHFYQIVDGELHSIDESDVEDALESIIVEVDTGNEQNDTNEIAADGGKEQTNTETMSYTIEQNGNEYKAIELPNKASIAADIEESHVSINDVEQLIDDVEESWQDGSFAAVGDQLQDGVAVIDDGYALAHVQSELRPLIDTAAAKDLSKLTIGDLNKIFVHYIEEKFEKNTSHALKKVEG